MKQPDAQAQFQRLLATAREVQARLLFLPAVAVGGTAAALYARHRVSRRRIREPGRSGTATRAHRDRNLSFDRFGRQSQVDPMQTTLRIDNEVYRAAKAQAASRGETITRFIEQALRERIARSAGAAVTAEVRERDRLMEALLKRTAHFRVGRKPTREEMNAR
jgi:hypothetical protein